MSFASVFSRCRTSPGSFRAAPRLLSCGILAAALAASHPLRADDAPGSQDTAFGSVLSLATVYTVLYETSDGAPVVFAAGDRLAAELLNAKDGSSYVLFNPPRFGSDSRIIYTAVQEQVLQPDSLGQPRLLVGGLFGKSVGQQELKEPAQNIARLYQDGTQDTTFNPGTGANDYVTSILPLGDGNIVVGGLFGLFNKESHKHLVRLFNNGSIDESFADGLRIDDDVLALAEQLNPATGTPTGSILIAGLFNEVGGSTPGKIARLDVDGKLDTTFNPTIDTRVLAIAVQPDGKIVIGGDFTSVNGTAVSKIARLNYDGSLDTTFSAGVSGSPEGEPNPVAVYVLKRLADGRLYVGGNFVRFNNVTRNYLARINADGSLDTAFDPGKTIINRVQCVAVQPDNKVLVGETLSRVSSGVVPASLIRLFGGSLVSLTASHPIAKEVGNNPAGAPKNGQFRVKRGGDDLSSPLTVYVKVTGTATFGADYQIPNLTVYDAAKQIYRITIPAGADKVNFNVQPLQDAVNEPTETVIATLVAPPDGAADYDRGEEDSATVKIKNS